MSILALDQGTTGTTALVFAHDGSIVGRAYSEFTQHYAHPGWVEHDAEEIWRVSHRVMREALEAARLPPGDLRAIGITNQRETTVVWDRATGKPCHRAIVWQSRQTAEICEQLQRDGHADLVRSRTGLVINAYFSGTKVKWILDRYPEVRAKAQDGQALFGTIDSWLVWNLTGGSAHVTDPTNAWVTDDGTIFVADGYGDTVCHRLSPDGQVEKTWGSAEPGTGPGEFRLPHAIAVDPDDRVLVADRENSRIQLFAPDGSYLAQWTHVTRPDDLFIDPDGLLYVAELGERAGRSPDVEILPHMPHASVAILDLDGELITRFGGADPVRPGNFFAPHGIWADAHGDLYVAEVVYSAGANRGLVPLDCHALQKFVRIRAA